MQKLTINDIARLGGVGKSTVSRVLNNDPKVRLETREKIEKIIQQYGFQPSKSARAMRGVGHRTIGIIVTRLASNAENQALSGILPLLYAAQCEPLIVESQFNPTLVQEHLDFFQRRGVDGVILFAFTKLDEKSLSKWTQKMVVIAKKYNTISSVCYDDQKAVSLLMQQLYQLGHRQIHYLGVSDNDQTTGYLRHQAYLQFCLQHQLAPRAIQGELGYDWAYQHIQALISAETSAILCATDTQAIGVMKYLQEQKRQDIQVCGVGNNPLLHFLFPNVVSVDLGFANIGETVVNQLFALLAGGEIQHFVVDCELIPLSEKSEEPHNG